MTIPPDRTIPFGIPQVGVQCHGELVSHDMVDMIQHAGPMNKRVIVRKGRLPGSAQTAGGAPVTLPRLRFDDDIVGPSAEAGQEGNQSVVALVEVNPHGRGEAKRHMKPLPAPLGQVAGPEVVPILDVGHGVQPSEFHSRTGALFSGSLHQLRIQVDAEHMDDRRALPAK